MTPRLHVFVLIDALGWRYVKDRDFLADLLPFRRPLRTVLGFSSGAIPSILTGQTPSQNGHWNLFYYDPAGSPFRWLRPLQFLPGKLLDGRIQRRAITELGRRVLGLGRLFECGVSPRVIGHFNWTEKRNIYEARGIDGVSSIFDELAGRGVAYRTYSYHRWTDEEILIRAVRDIDSGDARFYFLYLSEMDSFLHHHCTDAKRVEERLAWYGGRLRVIFERARAADPEASFTVFSDHGMTPVREHYDLVRDVDALGFRMPADYLAVYDSTMARFWFFDERARRRMLSFLDGIACGRLLRDEELRRLGVLFADRRYGEAVFLLHPGVLLARSDFHGGGWLPAGMHGYHPDDSDSDGTLLTDRPPAVAVGSIVDMHACMREAAGLAGDDAAGTGPAIHLRTGEVV